MTPHHLRKAGQGGPYTKRNLLTLCAHHNEWVEVNRALAVAWGLVVEHGQTIASAWHRLIVARIVTYWWDGASGEQPRPDAVGEVA